MVSHKRHVPPVEAKPASGGDDCMVVAVEKVQRLLLEHEQDRVEKLIILAQIKDVDPVHRGVSPNPKGQLIIFAQIKDVDPVHRGVGNDESNM